MAKCNDLIKQMYEDADEKFINEANDYLTNLKKYADKTGKNFMDLSRDYIEDLRLARSQDMYARAMRVQKNLEMHSFIVSHPKGPGQAALDFIGGSTDVVEGGRITPKTVRGVYSMKWAGALKQSIDDMGAAKLMENGVIDSQVRVNLYNLGKFGDKGPVEGTSQVAYEIARKMRNIFEDIHEKKLSAGSGIGYVKGYMGPQTHDPKKLSQVVYDEWIDFVVPLLDPESKILRHTDEDMLNERFQEIFENLKNDTPPSMRPTANIEKRMSSERVLVFKDGASADIYHQRFGSGTLWENTQNYIDRSARDLSLMEKLGPNIKDGLEDLKNAAMAQARGDVKAMNDVKAKIPHLERTYKMTVGVTRNRLDNSLAVIGQGSRILTSLMRFGMAAISSAPDFVNAVSLVSNVTGKSYLSTSFGVTKNLLESLFSNPSTRRHAANEMGLVLEDSLRFLHSELPGVEKPGLASRAVSLFYELNLQRRWTDGIQIGVARSMLRSLKDDLQTPFDSLPSRFKYNLKSYKIGQKEWGEFQESLRSVDDINNIVAALRERSESSADKISIMITDAAHQATLTPSDKMLASNWLLGDSVAGTIHGELKRNWAQAKSFAVEQMEVLKRIAKASPDTEFDYLNLGATIVALTGAGATSLYIKSLIKNETPPDPFDPKFVGKAILAGGGGGLLADAMFGGFGDPLENLASGGVIKDTRSAIGFLQGPLGSLAYDVTTKGKRAVKDLYSSGELTDKSYKDLRRLARTSIPGNNLPWFLLGFNYLTTLQMREYLEPGYTERYIRSMEGKEHLVEPTRIIGQ